MQMNIPENFQPREAFKGFPRLFCGSLASGGEFGYERIEERIHLNNTVILNISVLSMSIHTPKFRYSSKVFC